MNYAITIYPLSLSFKTNLEKIFAKPIIYLQISEFRKQPLWRILLTIIKLNAEHLLFPIEHKNVELFLPILKILTIFIRARKIIVVNEDFSCVQFHRYKVIASIWKLMTQTIYSYFSYMRCRVDATQLLKQPLDLSLPADVTRVLYLDATLWFGGKTGGSVGHIAGVANSLINHGYRVDYAAQDRLPLLSEEITHFKTRPPPLLAIPAELNFCRYNNQMIAQLSKQFSKYKFIYQRMSAENYAGVKLSKILKIPLVVEYNGSLVWIAKHWGGSFRFKKLAQQCEELCLHKAHLVVTISEVLKDELTTLGIPPQRIVFHPNCIDPVLFDPGRFSQVMKSSLRRQLGILADSLVVTYIGTFNEWHGIEILASAIRSCIDDYSEYFRHNCLHFLIIGDGPKMPVIKGILNKLPYKKHVILTGIIPQELSPQYLAISDIFLSPHVPNKNGSRFFGSPTKLFEYMAMGKAIIASDLEQIGRVLSNSLRTTSLPQTPPEKNASQLGILCEPGNVTEIIKAILFLVNNSLWRHKLGENARNEATSKYTWHNHVAVILERLTLLNCL